MSDASALVPFTDADSRMLAAPSFANAASAFPTSNITKALNSRYLESSVLLLLDDGFWYKGVRLYKARADPSWKTQLVVAPERGCAASEARLVPWQRIEMRQALVVKVVLGAVPAGTPV